MMYFIQFNEANFEIIKKYIKKYPNKFNHLEELFNKCTFLETSSEDEYSLLEPWIQWPSIYTGKKAKDHNIFRLGDVEKKNLNNLFNVLDDKGITSGFICPMNLNNNFKNCSYFIPDPWTKTKITGNFFLKSLYKIISFTVNNNSNGKIGFKNFFLFLISLVFFSKIRYWKSYIFLAYKAIFLKKKWYRALFLDLFIHNLNIYLSKKHQNKISIVFFNSLAHIQHHYFLNSSLVSSSNKNPNWYIRAEDDPIHDALELFDSIFEFYLKSNEKIFIATALSQVPSDKPVFYYRLKDHKNFLKIFNIYPSEVLPRMTRDFTLNFNDKSDCLNTEKSLLEIKINGKNLFQVDNRELSLFVTLIYPEEILLNDVVYNDSINKNALDHISFVAIKNGIHYQKGYLFSNIHNITNKKIIDICDIKYLFLESIS